MSGAGSISRRRAAALAEIARRNTAEILICPLCERPITDLPRSSLHHLTPKARGGTHLGTVRLHQICHSAIHARYTETEIAHKLNDVSALRAEPQLAEFIAWVKIKPPEFHARTRKTRERRR